MHIYTHIDLSLWVYGAMNNRVSSEAIFWEVLFPSTLGKQSLFEVDALVTEKPNTQSARCFCSLGWHHPCSDGVAVIIPHGTDVLLQWSALHPMFSYWVG